MTFGVIFDMDGVLIDSEKFYFARRLNYLAEQGVESDSQDIRDFVGQTEEIIWERLIAKDIQLRKKLYEGYRKYQQEHPIDYSQVLKPGAREVVQNLKEKKYSLAIASSSKRREIMRMLATTDLLPYFDFVISGHELTQSKPHPEIYQRAFAALSCEMAVAVEDSTTGIQSAKAAGLYTFAVKQSFEVDQKQADQLVTSLSELPLWISKVFRECH